MSEHKLYHELTKAEAVKRMLGDDADDQLILDMVEGQTDVMECAQAVLDIIDEDQILLDGIAAHLEAINARKDRIKHSLERRKALLQRMLDKLGVKSLKLPTATLTVRKGVPSVVITDENEIPKAFIVLKPSIDKKKLKNVLQSADIPGATLSNSPDTLTIRRK